MKISCVAALLALLMMVAAPLPAAASTGDHVHKSELRERGQGWSGERKAERKRFSRPHFAKRRSARHAVRARHHHHVARRSARRVAHRAPRRMHRADRRTYVSAGSGTSGMASYYYQGSVVASGARFNPDGLTAAHRTLPFGTKVRVTHLGNGRSVNVTINDRGPFVGGRIIDLSRGAANVIGMIGQGLARVSVTILGH
jgi:rare lipoprotein A